MPEKRFSFLNNLSDEDRILLSNIVERAVASREKRQDKYSFFLDERQQILCKSVLDSEKLDNYIFWGGYDDAQRKMIGLFPDKKSERTEGFPIKSICFTYRSDKKLCHRDFLGSLMSLQIERKCIGDIIIGECKANVLVSESVADRALYEIDKIGRIGVKAEFGFDSSLSAEPELCEITTTVSSLRADCIVSAAVRTSRDKAAQMIKERGIVIDHFPFYKTDVQLKEGQTFSVRGCGKFILKSIDGVSKKDRLRITLCKYI